MRHYLLASAAMIGLSVGVAQAATITTQSQGDFAASGVGPDFSSVVPAPQTSPDPGKVNVRLGGYLMTAFGVDGSNLNTGTSSPGPNTPAGTKYAKNDPYGYLSFAYLYFGIDGRMPNNIIYGAEFEVRENNQQAVGALTPGSTNVTLGNATGASSSTNSNNTFMFMRRAYGYIGTDQLGILELGSNSGPEGVFIGQTTGETYNRSGWDGDAMHLVPSNAAVNWVFANNGNVYTTSRLTYLSPTFFAPTSGRFNQATGPNGNIVAPGVNIALSFAPSTSTTNDASNANAGIGQGPTQQASVVLSDAARARNIYEALIKYSGPIGPVGFYGFVGYTGSNTVKYVGPGITFGGATGGNASAYKGLSIVDVAGTLSFAGVTVFGHLTTGNMNGPDTPEPITPHSKTGLAYVFGPQYAIGPFLMGASYYRFDSTGSASTVSSGINTVGPRTEIGLDLGGRYTMAPGIFFGTDLIYGTRHERGMNFIDSTASAPPTVGNNTHATAWDLSFNVMW